MLAMCDVHYVHVQYKCYTNAPRLDDRSQNLLEYLILRSFEQIHNH